MREQDIFQNELKQKLNDYRCQNLSLDEILTYIDMHYSKKLLDLLQEIKYNEDKSKFGEQFLNGLLSSEDGE